jgi:hypothetical protein
MRRLLCVILRYRGCPKKKVMGMNVYVCVRCGKVVSVRAV